MSLFKIVSCTGLVAILLWVATPACAPTSSGQVGGPCYGNGTCDNGLSCVADVCKEASPGKLGEPCYGNGTCDNGLSCVSNTCKSTADGGSTDTGVVDVPAPDQGTVDQTVEPTKPEPVTPDEPGVTDVAVTPDVAPEKVAESIPEAIAKFSFFVTSIEAMQKLSGSKDGFGGDLGGLAGADKICQTIAAGVGAGSKTWKAFLSVTKGPDGTPVNAIDRIGKGPWYDRNGRLIAQNVQGLLTPRPQGDKQAVLDMTNEHGQGQHQFGDNHDTMTGSNTQGKLNNTDPSSTCKDWTSAVGPGSEKKVMGGHSWPRDFANGQTTGRGSQWIADHTLRGCAAGVNLKQGPATGDCVGCSGGYGGIYCFALSP